MSSPAPAPSEASTVARRARLALLCALDRAHLRLIVQPAPVAPASPAAPLIDAGLLFDIARCLPGGIGRWARRAGVAADLLRVLAR